MVVCCGIAFIPVLCVGYLWVVEYYPSFLILIAAGTMMKRQVVFTF